MKDPTDPKFLGEPYVLYAKEHTIPEGAVKIPEGFHLCDGPTINTKQSGDMVCSIMKCSECGYEYVGAMFNIRAVAKLKFYDE